MVCSALEKIFNHLDLKELAAAASTCSTWRYEAALDSRWKAFWQKEVESDAGLWRWAQADGGYRQQLRAKRLVRRGDCTATVFPFSRRDGQVTEVLFFDGGPADGDKRILTVQAPKVPGQSVRLRGSTLKVWDAAALMAQRPLLVVHDVLKHMQLEDGLLFLWRIVDDATIITSVPEGSPGSEEARRWAEHPSIVASVLEPAPCRLRDCPLEASYGRGMTPCEWLDMSGGMIAGSLMVPSQNKLLLRLFDLGTGRCLRASSCDLPQEDQPLQMADQDVTMIVTRSGEAGCLVLATCALFDTRVFLWRLKDEWIAAGQAAARAAAALAASPRATGQQQQQQQPEEEEEEEVARRQAARAACWDPAAAVQVASGALAASPAAAAAAAGDGEAESSAAAAQRAQYELRHVYSTPDQEPVVDISISNARHCLYIVGMETITVADLSGKPFMRVSTLTWRGVVPEGEVVGPTDVGAFSWPLPNNNKAAFFLDTTNSLFIADFRRPQMTDWWYMSHTEAGPRHPSYDAHFATALGAGGEPQGQVNYYVQSHTDLRAPPKTQYLSTLHGRASGPRDMEPGIVEYTQDGGVLFTTAETACPAVASLLQLEKAGGSYLAGLGPASARFAAGGSRRQPYVARGGRGQRGQLSPRALVLIDTASGSRFKAVPVEGAIESLHSAGQYLVLAASELGGFPEGLNGSLVVLDFAGGPGFGCSAEPAGRGRARSGTSGGGGGRRRQGQQPKQQQAEQQEDPSGKSGKRKKQQEGEQRRRQGKGKSKAGSSQAARRSTTAAAAEEEPGPSRKRGRR
ncbi:hypothetical protein C2E21_8028 [Chlorella sorokiniana]|uniref:F-box domain-containing protein n=1 Tax=Chlorella sorokiniana TaxID=3076 RepID=A0A2P6TFD5_CHLSO|nr:hypothetical protein C2E21_8028 [Chlorella sorokiniana]|eukprot:PRW32830.1 hypothetical protein C2E21_8028 [Chlorella sorokiniana]